MPLRSLCIRTDDEVWTRGADLAEAISANIGLPITRSRALDLALHKGLDALEAEYGLAPNSKRKRPMKRKAAKRA